MTLVTTVNRRLAQHLGSVGRATSPEMLAAARVLRKSIRKVLGIRGNGKPSAPGEPPRKQSGKTQKSVISGTVGAGQRVAVAYFTAPLLEFGVNTAADARAGTVRSRRDLFTGGARKVLFASSERQKRRQRAQRKGTRRAVTIAPRPFMQRALAAAKDQMVDVMVSELRRRQPSA